MKEPWLIAFTTASSEAALPMAMENMEKFGVPRRIVSFVLPTGYSFNLDGSTLYLALASVFVAQAAGIELPLGQQLLMMLTLMLTSKGVAAVPRASLVILSGTLTHLRPAARGHRGDPGRGRLHGHGADVGEPARQLPRERGDGALGRGVPVGAGGAGIGAEKNGGTSRARPYFTPGFFPTRVQIAIAPHWERTPSSSGGVSAGPVYSSTPSTSTGDIR